MASRAVACVTSGIRMIGRISGPVRGRSRGRMSSRPRWYGKPSGCAIHPQLPVSISRVVDQPRPTFSLPSGSNRGVVVPPQRQRAPPHSWTALGVGTLDLVGCDDVEIGAYRFVYYMSRCCFGRATSPAKHTGSTNILKGISRNYAR